MWSHVVKVEQQAAPAVWPTWTGHWPCVQSKTKDTRCAGPSSLL